MKAVKAKLKSPLQQRNKAKAARLAKTKTTKIKTASAQLALPANSEKKSSQPVKQLIITDANAAQRLDNFLIRQLKGVPKSYVYKIIRDGQVRLNKKRSSVDARLAVDDIVRVPPVRFATNDVAQAQQYIPNFEFTILYEDDFFLALDKPAGMAVHGGSGLSYGVIEQLRKNRPHAKFLELVHRLDRETSGILLVAKKRSALLNLQQQFRVHNLKKLYLALVVGDWPAKLKVIDDALYKYSVCLTNSQGKPQEERRVKVVAKDDVRGKKAVSIVNKQQLIRNQLGVFSLLQVSIKTGRTHQIRVHLQQQGFPICGDAKYGDFSLNKHWQKFGLTRMFLHAAELQFSHPNEVAQQISLTAPLPSELQLILES